MKPFNHQEEKGELGKNTKTLYDILPKDTVVYVCKDCKNWTVTDITFCPYCESFKIQQIQT